MIKILELMCYGCIGTIFAYIFFILGVILTDNQWRALSVKQFVKTKKAQLRKCKNG